MFTKILKKDIKRNKVITGVLFLFIFMAALLVSGATALISELSGSMDELITKASAPHLAQMHAGEINVSELDTFAVENAELIDSWQIVELLNVEGAYITLGKNEDSEANSVMENAFVKQNTVFDFILNMDNEAAAVNDGEIVIPIYHMQQYDLEIGDVVSIIRNEFRMDFQIVSFGRDSLMNPSLISSKRFVISDNDWGKLQESIGDVEYLIQFQTRDTARINELETLYQEAGLPQAGAAMNHSLIKQIHALSDGISAGIIIFIALILVLISALCLRFTLLSAIEEDYRDIGVLRGMGISSKDISRIYLTKYTALSAAASISGYAVSLLTRHIFTGNITLYMGSTEPGLIKVMFPLAAAFMVFGAVILFCKLILRKIHKVSPIEAIRSGSSGRLQKERIGMKLSKTSVGNINIFLGVREVLCKLRVYGILVFIYTLSVFLMIVPLNFYTTLNSSNFISYMGASACDMRIDIPQGQDIKAAYLKTMEYLNADDDVNLYTPYLTASFKILTDEGEYENIKIETGNFQSFPLTYTEGRAPEDDSEIALSAMNAKEYGKQVNDRITVMNNGQIMELTVCGIYQDVTNGGKTAKALFDLPLEDVIRISVNINLDGNCIPEAKQAEYTTALPEAKTTDIDDYVNQTLGSLIDQLKMVVIMGFALAIFISLLITALFFKMLIVKDQKQIAIMRSLGFKIRHIRLQYSARALVVLLFGIIFGTAACFTLGESLAGMLVSGVTRLSFIVNPIISYFICPAVLAVTVICAIRLGGYFIKTANQLRVDAD